MAAVLCDLMRVIILNHVRVCYTYTYAFIIAERSDEHSCSLYMRNMDDGVFKPQASSARRICTASSVYLTYFTCIMHTDIFINTYVLVRVFRHMQVFMHACAQRQMQTIA